MERRTDTKMKVIEFVLLLYMSGGELIEYTVRDGLSEWLKMNQEDNGKKYDTRPTEKRLMVLESVVKN